MRDTITYFKRFHPAWLYHLSYHILISAIIRFGIEYHSHVRFCSCAISPNLPFPMGFPMVKHDKSHLFPVRLAPPLDLDSVVLKRFVSPGCCMDPRCGITQWQGRRWPVRRMRVETDQKHFTTEEAGPKINRRGKANPRSISKHDAKNKKKRTVPSCIFFTARGNEENENYGICHNPTMQKPPFFFSPSFHYECAIIYSQSMQVNRDGLFASCFLGVDEMEAKHVELISPRSEAEAAY